MLGLAGFDCRTQRRASRRSAADRDGLGPVHLKLFDPLDDQNGLSPLASAGAAIDLHNPASRWNKRLLDNSATSSGTLVYQAKQGGNLTANPYERLNHELEKRFAGADNAGNPLRLEGGFNWKSMGNPDDNIRVNYQEAKRAFYRLTMLPLINRTAWLAPLFDRDVRLKPGLERIAGLAAKGDALWARVGAATFHLR